MGDLIWPKLPQEQPNRDTALDDVTLGFTIPLIPQEFDGKEGKTTHKHTSAFDASSMQFCSECQHDVQITFGSKKNWAAHLKSHEHLNSTVLRKSATITSFFKMQNPLQNIGFVASVSHVNLIASSETAGGDKGTMNKGDKTLLLLQTVIEMEEFAPAGETIGSQLHSLHKACKQKLPGSSKVFEGAEMASCGECLLEKPPRRRGPALLKHVNFAALMCCHCEKIRTFYY
ncbi:hypothetical protein IW261DRAFT_1421320 [Armillaria novae-zelandiae]|uniref:Uncharacterized protein n=1 Tax=Armillaria novae-zelandiae TaxID=153914 RepID=A0AA39U8N3_9AGAR|nr:hypothetical protein IW261DRAFT_1421320 [Armillaria novae-zelandiae]